MKGFASDAHRILVVDDDHLVLRVVADSLQQAGFQVATALSGEDGLLYIKRQGLPHLTVVDINMPFGMDGFEFCERVRQFSDMPLIMLTAVDEDETIVQAIDLYAEDYMTKPFNPGELVARVRRVLRRIGDYSYVAEPIAKVDDNLSVRFAAQEIVVNKNPISLTPTETKLLYILMRNADRTVTTDFILRRLWPLEKVPDERLRVYIHRLRRKMEENPRSPSYILSTRGIGYTFKSRPE